MTKTNVVVCLLVAFEEHYMHMHSICCKASSQNHEEKLCCSDMISTHFFIPRKRCATKPQRCFLLLVHSEYLLKYVYNATTLYKKTREWYYFLQGNTEVSNTKKLKQTTIYLKLVSSPLKQMLVVQVVHKHRPYCRY